MEHFKTLVGVTLMAVCVWLYTIYEQILESRDQAPRILYALCAIAGLLIISKLWSERSRGARLGLNILALLLGAWILNWSAHPPVEYLDWRPFKEDTLAAERSAGHPVFVDFTADWCVSCKTFEALYLNKPKMAELFRARGITPLKVDLTDPSNPHWALLRSFNRTGIPAYLVYPPDGEPILLPEGPPLTLTAELDKFPLRSIDQTQSDSPQESTR
jgi:thiol:disulfide interchange protein DsbD